MAGFKTHITFSSALGVGYAAAGYFYFDLPWASCALGGGLCGLSGMLPDLDSDSGIPLRETLTFSSAVIPLLMVERLVSFGLSVEELTLCGAILYGTVRFGVGELLRRYTVHRGMFHSLPALVIAGLLAFLVCQSQDLLLRYYKSGAVMLGYFSHLFLDEVWSVEWQGILPRFKKSFGTAIKFHSGNLWADVSTYAKLVLLTYLAVHDPAWMALVDPEFNATAPLIADARTGDAPPANDWRPFRDDSSANANDARHSTDNRSAAPFQAFRNNNAPDNNAPDNNTRSDNSMPNNAIPDNALPTNATPGNATPGNWRRYRSARSLQRLLERRDD